MILLRLLEPEVDAALRRRRPRLPHEWLSLGQAGELLFDPPVDVFGAELARGDDEDVRRSVRAFVEALERIMVHTAHGLGRADDRAPEWVFVEDQRREVLVGQLVWPVLVHLDLLDDDLPLPL